MREVHWQRSRMGGKYGVRERVTLPKVKAGEFSDAFEIEERDQLLVEDRIPSIFRKHD